MKSESEVTQSCPTLATPWTAAYQAPPSMGFSRQEYWSGVPLPSPKSVTSMYQFDIVPLRRSLSFVESYEEIMASYFYLLTDI